jgi:hypothetical protein
MKNRSRKDEIKRRAEQMKIIGQPIRKVEMVWGSEVRTIERGLAFPDNGLKGIKEHIEHITIESIEDNGKPTGAVAIHIYGKGACPLMQIMNCPVCVYY